MAFGDADGLMKIDKSSGIWWQYAFAHKNKSFAPNERWYAKYGI
jgi:hypothetical protein